MAIVHRITDWGVRQLQGRASARIVAVFAVVYALDGADKGAIGAMAVQLEQALGINQTELGLLPTVSSAIGIVATVPFGWLVDRTNRMRVLTAAIGLWAVAMILGATATSYLYLLSTRLALGVVVAASVPAVASLMGDYFQPHLRGRMYGYILVGEMIGTGFGYIVSGELALLSWRMGFAALAVLALGVAWLVHRLPEPARGGADRLRPGQEHLGRDRKADRPEHDRSHAPEVHSPIRDMVRQAHVQPRRELLSEENPGAKPLWWVVWYILRIPTNAVVIIASALGYYYFAGLRTFGVEFAHGWYGVSHSAAIGLVALFGVGGLAGALVGGRLGDYLLSRRRLTGRILVATGAYWATALLLIPALLTSRAPVAGLALLLAGLGLGAVNPSLDAARLDIMHPYLWGRAESVRTSLRTVGEASAPLLFGYISQHAFGGGAVGLERTFLLMLVPLFVGGGIGAIALWTYPRDVATAEAYTQRTLEEEQALRTNQGGG